MILIEPALNDAAIFQEAVTLAGQVAVLGLPVVIRDAHLPDGLHSSQKYEASAFLRADLPGPVTALLVVGGNLADDAGIQALRRVAFHDTAPVLVFGHFVDRQAELTAAAKFAYVTGREPVCIDLSQRPELAATDQACPCFGVDCQPTAVPFLPDATPVVVWLTNPDAVQRRAWEGFGYSRALAPVIWTQARSKVDWLRGATSGQQIYSLNDLSPSEIARMGGILVVASEIAGESRVLCLTNNIAVSGGLVIDATATGSLALTGLPVLRGPADAGFLHRYLQEVILPNLSGLRSEMTASPQRQQIGLRQFLASHGVATPPRPSATIARKPKSGKKSVLFMPTNGVGLGHARRCTLIAAELPVDRVRPILAAFPSCGPMIAACGFDWSPLISKSSLHDDANANDIINSGRLNAMVAGCGAFVFDGGYVFDSALRAIVGTNVSAAWIRRGLWPALQDNTAALDRGKIFARIIIPGEAFAELNHSYSNGPTHFQVGPVVHRLDGDFQAARQALRRKLGMPFERLIVTMPGGGVATDMSAQVQTVCAAVEARPDVLHLILTWPGSVVPPVWHAWQRSRVVTTNHAAVLAAASDFIISAAGYNSFHEALYNRVPAIFVPQSAPYLDDQAARAEAAASRGVAAHVEAGRLGALEREIARFLDHGKAAEIRARLAALDLPAPGNREAASRILELLP